MELEILDEQMKELLRAVNKGNAKQEDITKRQYQIEEANKRFQDEQARMESRLSERQALMEERLISMTERSDERYSALESKINQVIDRSVKDNQGEVNVTFSEDRDCIPLDAIVEGSTKTVRDIPSHTVDRHFANVMDDGESI